jgi:hypothetical protein
MHGRRADISTDGHKLMHEGPHAIRALHHPPQLPASNELSSTNVATHATHHVSLYSIAFSSGFHEQDLIDNRPHDAMATRSLCKVSAVITQQMLRPLMHGDWPRARFIQISNT